MNKFYITNDQVSCNEQLGSQTFTYFALYAISKHTGHEVAFSTKPNRFNGIVQECFDTPFSSFPENISYNTYDSTHCGQPIVEENLLKLDPNINFIINARFDYGYVYWKDLLPELKNIFKIKLKFLEEAKSIISDIDKPIASLHFRRRDYPVYMDMHMNYYKNALASIPKDAVLLLFSDDFEWINNSQELQELVRDRKTIKANFNKYVSLSLLTLTDYNICSPSCFAILGSVLSQKPNHLLMQPYVRDNPFLEKYFLPFQNFIENITLNCNLIKF